MLMKKILSLVTLLMLFVVAAWADTESSGNIGESNVTIIGNSYSLDGKYVAGKGGLKQGNMPDKGVKLRSNQGELVFAVNAGYKISKFEFWGCGNTTTAVDIVSATVDGGNNLLSANVTLSAKGESTSGDIVLSDIEAVDCIMLTFAEGSNAQIVGTWKITYEQTEVITQEITAVTLNGVAISADNLATLKSTKELTIDGSNLNGIGVLGVTLSSGATTVTKTVDGTSFVYTFTINSTDNYTVTVTNVAKTYSQLGNVIAFSVNGENVEGANTNTVTSNGISFAMVDESKTFQYGMSKVTIGENVYVPLKLSTGSAINVTFPDGMVATKVVVYGWSANGNGKLAAMKEKNEEDAKSVDVSNDVYFATNIAADIYPSVYTYELDNWESLYFNPGGSPSQPFVVMDFVLKKAAEPEPVADGPVVLWENGETSTLDGYTYITIPASQLKDVAKAKDTIRVSFAIANVEARQATPARNVRTGEISLWFGVDEIKTISEINKDTKSVDFILKAADVEKLAAAESVYLKYKYLTVAKVEFVSAVAVPEPEPVDLTGKLVIGKVFYAGSIRLNGATPKNYMKHLYIELFNNSDETIDVAGTYIALANSDAVANAWTAAAMAESHPDSAVVKQIFQIPAISPVELEPGKSIVITNCAIDHSEIAEGNVDLSTADFEIKSTNAGFSDHSENVPALIVVKTFGTTDFMNLLNPGPDGIVLLPANTDLASCPETYPKDKTTGNLYTIVPLANSIDCVDIVKQKTPSADDKRFAEAYDAGFTCTLDINTFNCQAVARKVLSTEIDGRKVLQDTNNSSNDFETLSIVAPRIYGEGIVVGITNVSSQKVADVEIYNLQGVRMSQLQKGINIVNGKKVVIK